MGRAPCCDKQLGLKKGPWTADEDDILTSYISKHGPGNWRSLPKLAGLLRCGKSCRLRWTNYLRPDIKRGSFTAEEEKLVIQLHGILGNKWAAIASQLSGRTDNEVKNLWNTHLRKRLQQMGLDPQTHKPISTTCGIDSKSASARHMAQWESARLQAESRLSRESLLFSPTQAKADTTDDYFLRIWNSEIGDSFRKLKKGSEMACQSPISQASSSTKCGSVSGITLEMGHNTGDPCSKDGNEDENKHKSSYREGTLAESDSSSSNELEDSSDTALQLLLDFPINNDMSFLGHSDDYFSCH